MSQGAAPHGSVGVQRCGRRQSCQHSNWFHGTMYVRNAETAVTDYAARDPLFDLKVGAKPGAARCAGGLPDHFYFTARGEKGKSLSTQLPFPDGEVQAELPAPE